SRLSRITKATPGSATRHSSRRWPVRSTPVLPLHAAFLLVAPIVPLFAQQTGTVSGTVAVTESGAPLAGASVVVVGTARSVLTNDKGLYHLSVPVGVHSVRARLIGYEAAEQRVVVPPGRRSPSISSSPPRRSPSTKSSWSAPARRAPPSRRPSRWTSSPPRRCRRPAIPR